MKTSLKTIASLLTIGVLAAATAANALEAPVEASGSAASSGMQPVSSISVEVTPLVQETLGSGTRFDVDALRASLQKALEAEGLFHPEMKTEATSLEVVITRVKFPSKLTAFTLGALAGKNPIAGNVAVKDSNWKTLALLHVTTSRPLGLFAHRQDDVHLERLYDAFAESTLTELKGE